MDDCKLGTVTGDTQAMPALLRKVEEFLRQADICRGGVLVAVSGGPDSVALLLALHELSETVRELSIRVAHFNHLLRGQESQRDEQFVRELAGGLSSRAERGLPFFQERADVRAAVSASGGNLEATARRLRYKWLAQTAAANKCAWVATGHTADDQAETVLHRLLRGTGLQGLRGISASRVLAPGVQLVRPLLQVRRSEVLAYLQARNQFFQEDRSNFDTDFTRNRIRHELLPQLAQHYNPAISLALTRLASQASEHFDERQRVAQQVLAEAELPRAGSLLVFEWARLTVQARPVVRDMFRAVWTREGWHAGGMGFREWDRLAAVTFGELTSVDLPGAIRARRQERVIQVGSVS